MHKISLWDLAAIRNYLYGIVMSLKGDNSLAGQYGLLKIYVDRKNSVHT